MKRSFCNDHIPTVRVRFKNTHHKNISVWSKDLKNLCGILLQVSENQIGF